MLVIVHNITSILLQLFFFFLSQIKNHYSTIMSDNIWHTLCSNFRSDLPSACGVERGRQTLEAIKMDSGIVNIMILSSS